MLNTCLTVKAGSPASHADRGWEKFTEKVVAVVDKWGGANLPTAGKNSVAKPGVGRGVVFMAWGSFAQKRVHGLNRVSQLPTAHWTFLGLQCLRPSTSFVLTNTLVF